MNLQEIVESIPLKFLIKNLFGNKKTELVERPGCFFIKIKNEKDDIIQRIILLPPHGYTANKINEMNPHPEARSAKISIRGGIKPNKRGFILLKDLVKFIYSTKRDISTKKNEPYVKIDLKENSQTEKIKSSKEKFFVVRENGMGFYHSLINLSNEWVVLVLEKYLQSRKELNLKYRLNKIGKKSQNLAKLLLNKIKLYGDKIFEKENQLIIETLKLDIKIIIPLLIEMLNFYETGKHEPCTVFALILKIGKKNKTTTTKLLETALNKDSAPKFYLKELLRKLIK